MPGAYYVNTGVDTTTCVPPSSPMPKTFATTFSYNALYLTIGSGSRLSTAGVHRLSMLTRSLGDDQKLHEETRFAELNVFPVIPKIVQGMVFVKQPELVIVWAEDCLVMVPVSDVLRGGEVCSSGIISTQRHVLLVTLINKNTIRVFFSNGSIDDVRFEKSPTGVYKYVRIKSRVATFRKGKFLSLCNCIRDTKSIGVKLLSTANEVLDMPTVENIAMPKIYSMHRNYLYMECPNNRSGYTALLPDGIYVTEGTGDNRHEWFVEGRFTCAMLHDKYNLVAGDERGYLHVFNINYAPNSKIRKVGKRWFPSSGGIKFISRDFHKCIVVEGSGAVHWLNWTDFTFPFNKFDSYIISHDQPVRSASWGLCGLVVIEGETVKCMQMDEAENQLGFDCYKERKVSVGEVRTVLRNRKLKMTRTTSCCHAYSLIVTIVYGDHWIFMRSDCENRLRSNAAAEWERCIKISSAPISKDLPKRLSIISVNYVFPNYLICQTTHSIIVYDTEKRRDDKNKFGIHSYLEMKIPIEESKRIGRNKKAARTHVITAADAVLTSDKFCKLFGVKPTGRRFVVGTQTGLILWSHIPFEATLKPYPLLRHSSSAATGGRPVVRILNPNEHHIQAITSDARLITMFAVPTETVEAGISVTDVRKNHLILTSPAKSGQMMRIPLESRRSYCSMTVDARAVVYYIRDGKAMRAEAYIPEDMCLMDGYGSARITCSIALLPPIHTDLQSTLIVTGNNNGQISLYKMDNQAEFCQLRAHLLKLNGKISTMSSIYHEEPQEHNFAVAVGGAKGQLAIFTINGLVPYVRHQTPERSTAVVVALEFVQHFATRLSLVVILGNGAVETYQVITSLGAKLFDDQIPCYDVTLISMTSINPISQPIAAAYLLPAYSMRGGNVACFGCYKWPQMSHPMELVTVFRFDSGTVKRYELAECETQKESYNIYESKSTLQSSAIAMRFVVTPLSKRLFICVNGGNDGTLTMLAHCDDRVRHVFGHLDRCHDSKISSIQLSQWRTSQGFYLLVSSLDQSGLVIIRRMLVSNQKIFFDPQPIRKYVSIRRPSQLMMIPEKKHVIVTGEGIQVISYSAHC